MKQKYILYTLFIALIHGMFLIKCVHFATISIPKCGTHLLLKTISSLSGINGHTGPKGWCILDDDTFDAFLKKPLLLKTHALYSNHNIEKFRNPAVKTFFIHRDPRDQIISMAFWVKRLTRDWPIESKLPIETIISELITGGGSIWGKIFSSQETWQNLSGITEFYNLYLPWITEEHIYSTTFEKLIGIRGGGDKDTQIQEIIKIASFMNKEISLREAEKISNGLFGGSMTFREGKIGSWKKYFTDEHKNAFKQIAGNLLILLGYEKDLSW